MFWLHYSLAELEMFTNNKMSSLKALLCKWHLKHCAECTARLKELETDNQFAEEICKGLEDLKKFDE